METQTALVRADRGVELDAVTAVDLHLALIVGPCDAELHHALRLDDALKHARLLIFRMLRNHRLEAFENLANGLQELRLVAIALLDLRVHALDVLVSEHILPLRDSWVTNRRSHSMCTNMDGTRPCSGFGDAFCECWF